MGLGIGMEMGLVKHHMAIHMLLAHKWISKKKIHHRPLQMTTALFFNFGEYDSKANEKPSDTLTQCRRKENSDPKIFGLDLHEAAVARGTR